MPGDKGTGIADDAADYADLPESDAETPRGAPKGPPAPPERPTPPPRGASGIASDADMFADMLEESTDAVTRLDSAWLYQQAGQVFGPIAPKELLEMLYRGEITAETPIAPEDGDFTPLRRIGAFRAHLPKVEAHRREVEAEKARAAAETRARMKKRLGWAAAALGAVIVGSVGIAGYVQHVREAAAEAEKAEKEAALKAELDGLLASVTIEPPLLDVVDEDAAPRAKKRRRRRRRAKKGAVAKFSGAAPATGELTRNEIMRGVGKAFPKFKRCIVEQIQRDPESVPEQVVLTFSVDNAGKAKGFSLADRFLRRSPMLGCMRGALYSVSWRAYKGEVQNIEYPITVGRH